MKKAYINPTTDIIKVEMAQMIAASGDFNDSLNDTGIDGADALSRDNLDIWGL